MKNKFWNFVKNEVDPKIGQLDLYGEISDVSWFGDEVTPAQFKKDLDSLGDIEQLDIYINSPGGDVFAGQAIYSILKRTKAHITVHIDGLAASIASIVAMAGDEIIMPKNAMMMIHNAWTYAAGNKDELRDMADTLDKIDSVLVDVYASKTGREKDEIVEKMNAETWFTADEALGFGLIDSVGEEMRVAAMMTDMAKRYHNVPNNVILYENDQIETSDDEIKPCNGEVSQPVEDIKPIPPAEENPLDSQRQEFNRIKRKLLGKD